MLLPQLIDRLNQRNTEAIRNVESQHRHVRHVEKLAETLGAIVTDIQPHRTGPFVLCLTLPCHWDNQRIELSTLLQDYGYTGLDTYSWPTGTHHTTLLIS